MTIGNIYRQTLSTDHLLYIPVYSCDPFLVVLVYPNGTVIKRVTACNYTTFESRDAELGICQTYCPQSDLLCPKPEPNFTVPSALTKRGLQVSSSALVSSKPTCLVTDEVWEVLRNFSNFLKLLKVFKTLKNFSNFSKF